MALPPLASVDDLSEWMGVDVSDEVRAEAILSAASTLVRSHTGQLWVDAAGEPDENATDLELDTVKTVVTLVAERVWSNPRGFVQQATGPFSGTVAEWSAYGLALTDSEKDMLGCGNDVGIPGLASIRVEAPRGAAGAPRLAVYDLEQDDE